MFKEDITQYCKNCFELAQQLDQLRIDNEDLKKIIERLDVPKHEVIDMDIAFENEKLKQTLIEIKEIAEVNKSYKFKIPEICCAEDTLELKFDVLEQILQKINEVDDETTK